MASLDLGQVKKQASFFLREKLRTARLALTDVTEAELLTEEATNGDPWGPETRTMAAISQAAFEVDDYWRIVGILHKRLSTADKKQWRESFKTLVLLEYLVTHGPESVAAEFQTDMDLIQQLERFQCIDDRGFDWGLNVRKKVQRILELLSERTLLKEERNRARKLSREIRGFGSFISRTTPSASSGEFSTTSSCAVLGNFNTAPDDIRGQTTESFDKENNGIVDGSRKNCEDDFTTHSKSSPSSEISTISSLSDQSSSDEHLLDSCTSTLHGMNRSQTEIRSVSHGPNREWKPFKESGTSRHLSFSRNGIQNQSKDEERKEESKIQGNIERFQESCGRIEPRSSLNSSTGESNENLSTLLPTREIHPFNDLDKEGTTECLLSDTCKKSPLGILDISGSGALLSKKLSVHLSFRSKNV